MDRLDNQVTDYYELNKRLPHASGSAISAMIKGLLSTG